jgi:competence protein ComEC
VLYTIRVVEWFDTLPIRSFHIGQIGVGWIALIYLAMALISFGWPIIYSYSSTLKPSLAVGGLALAAVLIWRGFFSAPDGYLHVYLFNVGTGTGMYIQNPSGRNLLVNGGPSTKTLSDHLGRLLPPFQRNLDYIIISSPQEQDLDSVAEILPRFCPREVIWLGSESLSWEAQHLRQTLEDHGIPLTGGEPGQILEIGDVVRLKFLAESERGGTLLLEYGHFRLLLPFGINQEDRIDFRMGRDLGEMTALLLADNGYQSSNPSEWIKNLNPQFLLLSVGIADSQGLPDQGLIDRLAGYSLLRTDQHGMIQITTDGKLCWIEVEKLD